MSGISELHDLAFIRGFRLPDRDAILLLAQHAIIGLLQGFDRDAGALISCHGMNRKKRSVRQEYVNVTTPG